MTTIDPKIKDNYIKAPKVIKDIKPILDKLIFKKDRPHKDRKGPSSTLPGYRDRAAERRETKEEAAEDEIAVEQMSKLDPNMTKYLGGDMEHTHLVKGLDYALLERSRQILDKPIEEQLDEKLEEKIPEKLVYVLVFVSSC